MMPMRFCGTAEACLCALDNQMHNFNVHAAHPLSRSADALQLFRTIIKAETDAPLRRGYQEDHQPNA